MNSKIQQTTRTGIEIEITWRAIRGEGEGGGGKKYRN